MFFVPGLCLNNSVIYSVCWYHYGSWSDRTQLRLCNTATWLADIGNTYNVGIMGI